MAISFPMDTFGTMSAWERPDETALSADQQARMGTDAMRHVHPADGPTRRRNGNGRTSEAAGYIQIVRFHVWQELGAASRDGAGPLHAALTVDMSNQLYYSLTRPGGMIRIDGTDGRPIVEARMLINQAHYGLGLTQPDTRQVQFTMHSTAVYVNLGRNQLVHGMARIYFGERRTTLELPETRIIFTR